MASAKKPIWKRPKPPIKKAPAKLSAAEKAKAKGRAKRAGRSYPNMVDNMNVAKARSSRKTSKRPRSK